MSDEKRVPREPRPSLCYDFPIAPDHLTQIVLPRDMTEREAERLIEFVRSLITVYDAAGERQKPVPAPSAPQARVHPISCHCEQCEPPMPVHGTGTAIATPAAQEQPAQDDALIAKLDEADTDWRRACFRPDGELSLDEAALRDVGYNHGPLFAKAAARLAALRDQVAELRADAERYRWLRSHPVFQIKELPNELELLDASIDRYRAGMETEE